MSGQVFTTLGGLGLFLLGMTVMTDGLRGLAGDSLQTWLARFTRSPYTGAMTGTVSTAILQSSSATTVTTVGLVAAGLLSFPQALGIIFGANVGTTITGWMVALIGFKLKVGAAALPVIFIGMMLRIFGRGRWPQFGATLAGFGLIFLGIAYMQDGMAGVEQLLSPEQFPPDSLGSRILLVLMGAALTVVTQSSSAGVAIAMTALSAGAISFPQAAALVIGMDVGTTVTAMLASVGTSVEARRTGFSHMFYNVFTALAALLVLSPYVWAVGRAFPGAIASSPELALVGFHTFFNVLALVIGLPLTGTFARLMERLVPDNDQRLSRRLDPGLLVEPKAAGAAMMATLNDEFVALLAWLETSLAGGQAPMVVAHEELHADIRESRLFLDRLNQLPASEENAAELATAFHALDHLHRLYHRLRQRDQVKTLLRVKSLESRRETLLLITRNLLESLPSELTRMDCEMAENLYRSLRQDVTRDREDLIGQAVERDIGVQETGERMAARRWLERTSNHIWRVSAHLGGYEVGEEEKPD